MRATSPDSKVADLVSLDAITVERRGAAFWVHLNRPDALNSLTLEMARDLELAIETAEADPAVRAAVQRATFELLVGFQLTEAQLRYNATR